MSGYSATPLPKKLGLKPGMKIRAVNPPEDYLRLLDSLPEDAVLTPRLSRSTDLVHIFAHRRSELAKALKNCRKTLDSSAVIWVSWPKKASGVATDIVEDTVRELALPLGLVDVKVCAVTDVWSGLKLVVRKELR